MSKKPVIQKQDLAWWEKDSVVEIWVITTPSDPELYRAKCLTAGTFPVLQVLKKGSDVPHTQYLKPLRKGEYVIWGYAGINTLDETTDNTSDDLSVEDCDFSFIW